MQDKKVTVAIVLAVLAVISLIYGVTASPKGKVKNTAVFQSQTATPSQSVIPVHRRAARSQFKSWKKSPFISKQIKPPLPKLILNGIVWNTIKPKAMIGSDIVAKGDVVNGNKVIDIKPDKVILNDGTKDFELKMEK